MRSYNFLQWIIFIISSLLVIIGCLCLVMATWPTHDFLSNLVKLNGNVVYILIIILALFIVTGIVGWVGLFHRSRSVLGSFTVLLLFTLTAGTIGGIWTFIKASKTNAMSVDRVRNIVLHDYGKDASKTAILDVVQQSFQCCGSDDYSSWALSMYSRIEFEENINSIDYIFAVPQSCCINPLSETCQQNRKITTNQFVEEFIYTQGCVSKLQASFIPFGKYSLLVSIGTGLIELTGIFGSILLCRTLRHMENAIP